MSRQSEKRLADRDWQCKRLLEVLKDGKPHRAGDLKMALGWVASTTFQSRLAYLREQGHNILFHEVNSGDACIRKTSYQLVK
jgi:hypothetical protein